MTYKITVFLRITLWSGNVVILCERPW